MKIILSVVCAMALAATPVVAQQYPTIVGSWYSPDQDVADCTTYWGVQIEPMSLLNGEMRCNFDTVRRDGWQVTWTGQCFGSSGDIPKITVTALETNGRLDMWFSDGGTMPGLKRCAK